MPYSFKEVKMEKALNFILNNFLSSETDLLYDYLVDGIPDRLTGHLPSPSEIQVQFPNPCGWGTGMEDSVLSGGSLIDGLIAYYGATGDKSVKELTGRLFKGMMRCVVDIDEGFIARSVSPVDKKSFYFDTSRDQYTHWVYSALRLYNSPLCEDSWKKDIENVLVAFAKRLQRNVIPENDYNMLRYDGKISIAGKMWGDIGTHEYFRLPFFYIAAFHVSGDRHWFDMYMKYRDEAFRKMQSFHGDSFGLRCYPVLQMQYSLKAAYDIDPDPVFKENCRAYMKDIAAYYEGFVLSESEKLLSDIKSPKNYYKYRAFREVPFRNMGAFGEKEYLNAAQSEIPENSGFYLIRNVGEAASCVALCPDYDFNAELFDAVKALSDAIDYSRIGNYSPMLLWCGFWLMKEAKK